MSGGGARSGPGISPARNGSSWIRRRKRLAIYDRDDFRCLYCGAQADRDGTGTSEVVLTLDHYDGHSNEPGNLVTCCLSCNSAKKNLTKRAWWKLLRRRLDVSEREIRNIGARLRHRLKKPLDYKWVDQQQLFPPRKLFPMEVEESS